MNEKVGNLLKAVIPAKLRPGIKRVYKTAAYFGLKHECPFCKSHLRTLMPFGLDFSVLKEKMIVGGGRRPNVRCPVCGSTDRERLLYLFLKNKTDIFKKSQRTLHIAPEKMFGKVLCNQSSIDYITADLYNENVMVKMDITKIQYSDDHFDSIICNHVLEHIVDDIQAMSELHRVLKPQGWAILQVPISLSLKSTYEDFTIINERDRERAFGQSDHVRIYAKDYKDRLEQTGFKVDVLNWTEYADDFGGDSNKYALNKQEAIYFARKQP